MYILQKGQEWMSRKPGSATVMKSHDSMSDTRCEPVLDPQPTSRSKGQVSLREDPIKTGI